MVDLSPALTCDLSLASRPLFLALCFIVLSRCCLFFFQTNHRFVATLHQGSLSVPCAFFPSSILRVSVSPSGQSGPYVQHSQDHSCYGDRGSVLTTR